MQSKTIKKNSTTVTFQGAWENEIDSVYKEKLKVDGIAYKYRTYYKTVWDESKENLLTFIMLNPSTADQYSNDPSVNNCIKIAKKYEKYGGIEVLNVYSLRHPDYSKIVDCIKKGEGNPKDMDYDTQCTNVVLAWGNKKVELNKKLQNKILGAEHIYILGAKDPNKINKDFVDNYNKNKLNQIRHPDNRAWTKLGNIDNAGLFEIDKDKYKNGVIERLH